MQPVEENENTGFKTTVLHLKINLVSLPTRGGGVRDIHSYIFSVTVIVVGKKNSVNQVQMLDVHVYGLLRAE